MIWDILYYVTVFNALVWGVLFLVFAGICLMAYDSGQHFHNPLKCAVFCLVFTLVFQGFASVAYVKTKLHLPPAPCLVCESKSQTARYASHNLKYFTADVAEYINSPCITPDCINYTVVE